jgi:hypothetical protein
METIDFNNLNSEHCLLVDGGSLITMLDSDSIECLTGPRFSSLIPQPPPSANFSQQTIRQLIPNRPLINA